MGKAVLVMDMPKKCGECDLFVCYRQYAGDAGDCFCGKTKQDTPLKGVPSWCPFKLMPEKTIPFPVDDEEQKHFCKGWNACIDAICGKE